MNTQERNDIEKFIDGFVETNGKVCWESSYEEGQLCIGENVFRRYAEKNELRIKSLLKEVFESQVELAKIISKEEKKV